MIKKIMVVVGIVCLVLLSLVIYHNYFTTKVAYVDIPKVFGTFDMKKELQDKYKKVEIIRNKVLDSLSLELQILSKKLKDDQKNKDLIYEFDTKREYFFNQKKEIAENNVALSNQYDKQILEQLTQYILDYGKKNGYDLILGADGNGTLMYANEKMNISEEISKYVNDRYKGLDE